MSKIEVENAKITVKSHPNAGRDYCVLTLEATVDGVKYNESIGVASSFLFENANDSYRKQLMDDIITKLSFDLITKSFKGFDKSIKKHCNQDEILKNMRSLYEN